MTANVEQRLSKHLSNHKGYTSRAKDWKVVFVEDFVSKEQALDKERQIKKWKSRKAILKLIKDSEHPD